MSKRFLFIFSILFFSILGSGALYAQQLTRFALVDLSKVYTAFFRDSRAVRDFEQQSLKVQAEIDKRSKEIEDLKLRHSEAVLRGDQSEAARIDNHVYNRTEALREYFRLKTAELEDQKRKLMQSGSFLNQVYDEIRYIAESEGYSAVFDLKDLKGILWYSPTIDITDKLIQNLLKKAGN